MSLEVLRVTTPDQMQEALLVRRAVFIEEQGVPEDLEIDEHDEAPASISSAIHVLARIDGLAVATGRLLLREPDERIHIGRVAVLAERRREGLGRAVMLALQNAAREQEASSVTLAAQLHAIGFYERLGYAAYGDVFLDAGIEHRWMDLKL